MRLLPLSKAGSALAAAFVLGAPTAAYAHANAVCGAPVHLLQTVADVNADGVVDGNDLVETVQVVIGGGYYALYDRNGDGALTAMDVVKVAQDIGKTSTTVDQQIGMAYHRFIHFQEVQNTWVELYPEFQPFTSPVAGHGVHWANRDAMLSISGFQPTSFEREESINVPADGSKPWAMFWGEAATPVFEGGAMDYPMPGGEWETQRVIAFSDRPPKFTADPKEHWHTHAGLCSVVNAAGQVEIHQYTTYAECQAYPSLFPTDPIDGDGNAWNNLWMVHLWLFNLNPRGIWGGTHPCLDPWAPSEEDVNDGREEPEFFMHWHMGHEPTWPMDGDMGGGGMGGM